jgi:hypothetical protein
MICTACVFISFRIEAEARVTSVMACAEDGYESKFHQIILRFPVPVSRKRSSESLQPARSIFSLRFQGRSHKNRSLSA